MLNEDNYITVPARSKKIFCGLQKAALIRLREHYLLCIRPACRATHAVRRVGVDKVWLAFQGRPDSVESIARILIWHIKYTKIYQHIQYQHAGEVVSTPRKHIHTINSRRTELCLLLIEKSNLLTDS